MRLPENKIKEAILNPDLSIRQRAVRFFAKSNSIDESVMPQVITAVEMFGRADAYHLIGLGKDLPQTEETIHWVIDELNDVQSGQFPNYTYNLSMVLVKADPALLLQNESAVLEARHFLTNLHAGFSERLQMLSWDEATCWEKLEEFCENAKDRQFVNDVNLGHARRIVEALARYGEECEHRVRSILEQTVEDYRHNPLKWLEPLAVRLAGEAKLRSTVSLIVSKLLTDGGDLLNEECAEALAGIGTAEVLEAIAEVFPSAPQYFRIYASEPLERIHSELAVDKCLGLLRSEKDRHIQINLAHALLSHFAEEGIEVARQLLVGRKLDFEDTGLRSFLLETCAVMGRRFPEFDDWLAAQKAEQEEHRKRVKELENDPASLIRFALNKLAGNESKPKVAHPSPPATPLAVPRKPPPGQKIGRNDPCPCGSGKKFKKCCMDKSGGDSFLN